MTIIAADQMANPLAYAQCIRLHEPVNWGGMPNVSYYDATNGAPAWYPCWTNNDKFYYPLMSHAAIFTDYNFNDPSANVLASVSWRGQSGLNCFWAGMRTTMGNIEYVFWGSNTPVYAYDGQIGGFAQFAQNAGTSGMKHVGKVVSGGGATNPNGLVRPYPSSPKECATSPWLMEIENVTSGPMYFSAVGFFSDHSDDSAFYAMCYRKCVSASADIEQQAIYALPRAMGSFHGTGAWGLAQAPNGSVSSGQGVGGAYTLSHYCYATNITPGAIWYDVSDWLTIQPGEIMQFFTYAGVLAGNNQSDDQMASLGVQVYNSSWQMICQMKLL